MPLDFGSTLKKCRNNSKTTVKKIAELLTSNGYKTSESTIYNWENNHSQPTPGAFLLMCDVYKIDDILGTFGYGSLKRSGDFKASLDEQIHIKKYRALDGHGKKIVDVVLDEETERMQSLAEQAEDEDDDNVIDVDFSSLKASAGNGFDLFDAPTDKLRLVLNNTTRQADICIKVDGHSMEPVFCDGDILLVRNQPSVNVGEYGIFVINDCGYVKKQGTDRLISVNDEYDDIYPNEYDNVRCCGKVIGVLDTDWIVN